MRLPIWIVPATIAIAFAPMNAGSANGADDVESMIKAAVVFNLVKFVDWPPAPADSSPMFAVAVLGDDEVCEALRTLFGKRDGSRLLEVVEAGDAASLRDCRLVYFGGPRTEVIESLLRDLDGHPALTVSDGDEFAEAGGMVQLVTRRSRVGFLVNLSPVERADLRISSNVLKMAALVE